MAERHLAIPFSSSLTNLTEVNPSFDKGIMRVAYTGRNQNNSFISKDTFEKCIDTIYNIPVVAHYNRETDTIGGHDIEMIITDDGIKMVPLTQPVGVVPESAQWYWEEVEDTTGIHEYLCVEVLIWKRQECYDKIVKDGFEKQSMEITTKQAEMQNGVLVIDDFYFTALTLLGDNVTPCFESAGMQLFSQNFYLSEYEKMKEDFRKEFSKIQEGGTEMNEKLELLQQYSLTQDDLDFSIDELTYEDLEAKLKEMKPDEPENQVFTLNLMEWMDEVNAQLDAVKFVDRWGYECNKYWFRDVQGNEVIVDNAEDRWRTYGIPVVESGDKITLDFANIKRKKVVYEDFAENETVPEAAPIGEQFSAYMDAAVANMGEVKSQLESVTNQYSEANTQLHEIQGKYQAMVEAEEQRVAAEQKAAKDEVFAKFDKLIGSDEEYKAVKEKAEQYSVAEIETLCYAMYGKKKAVFSTTDKKNPTVTVGTTVESHKPSAYGDLFNFKNK